MPLLTEPTPDAPETPRPPRPWSAKFGDALRGLKKGIRGQSSFFVHFFFAALVIAAAIVLQCGLVEWCVLVLCMGLVLTAELFNSAVEAFFRGLDEPTKEKTWHALDIAAGAVLVASVFAAAVGLAIFLQRLIVILQWTS
ncbi:MAG: diacylglycerol kinase [Gemmataceae bacterium]|nr:diacylglycerol kinase [Gemmataceae bacterium]MCI0737579.1 diacylglycerol kinase [Gemmataceae bacterium]